MLKLKNVFFAYDEKPVLNNISFTAEKGENISIMGASGCGKSTLLKIIYGLLQPSEGLLSWGDKKMLGPDYNLVSGEDFIKYLAQDFDLMLPLSVAHNVGKYLSNMYPVKKKRRIRELLELVEMEDLADTRAMFLSGGQQQRVALARALAQSPELLLLDEPFSHIDHFRKNNLRRNIFAYLKKNSITCLVATHDITDALAFADETIVLKNQKIYAHADPEKLYNQPPSLYVASLFGDVNEFMLKDLVQDENSRRRILLYPHEIKVCESSGLEATVKHSYFKGRTWLIETSYKGKNIFVEHSHPLEEGATVFLKICGELIASRLK